MDNPIKISLNGIDKEIYHKVKVYCVDKKIKIPDFINDAMKDKLKTLSSPKWEENKT